MAERKVPRIRFKGFEEDWEQRKVSELADRYDNLRVPVAEKMRVRGATPYYGANGIQDYVEGFTHDGEFVLVAEDGANDLKNYPVQYVEGHIWVNNHAHVLQGKNKITDTRFLGYAISRANIEAILVGGGRAKLNAEVLMRLVLILPGRAEQIRLSSYLAKLDSLLSLHQRKLEKLKILKKAMLEKMFPKNGAKVPEIRFSGFTDDWEQRKLGEIAKITMGQSPDGSTYSTEEGAYILVQGNADLKDGWVLPRVWTTQKTRTCDAGDLIISVRAPAGAIGRTAYDAVIGRGVAAIKGNEFIFQTLVKLDLNEYWKGSAVGSTFEAINSDVLINQMILIPSELEQKVIGEYFKSLDSLLSLHQRKLEKLRQIKKSMLGRMFV